jgi:8-oxo-dGTP pyrophosphatase MutT (NUDIX family)
MYKVFINDKPLFFTDNQKENATGVTAYKSADSIIEAIEKLETDPGCMEIWLYHEDINSVKKTFFKLYHFIEAAGGLIKNDLNEILFIFRLERWDLPKGKIETGETPVEAGLREVTEECGIQKLQVLQELVPTFHTYEYKGKKILKKTYWFEMFCSDPENIKAQTEENITGIEWVPSSDLSQQMSNTYGSIKEVLGFYLIH